MQITLELQDSDYQVLLAAAGESTIEEYVVPLIQTNIIGWILAKQRKEVAQEAQRDARNLTAADIVVRLKAKKISIGVR